MIMIVTGAYCYQFLLFLIENSHKCLFVDEVNPMWLEEGDP